MQEEDEVAAGWCARLCETQEGAEDLDFSEGLEAFILVARGQSIKEGAGGLMAALAQAAIWGMSPFKVAVFETIAAAGRWPSIRAKVVQADVLSIVLVALLAKGDDNSQKHPPEVRALMARLCALAIDDPEAARAGGEKRAKLFAAERDNVIGVSVIPVLVEMVGASSEPIAVAAAADTLAAFAGPASDGKARATLLEAGAVTALLARLGSDASKGSGGDGSPGSNVGPEDDEEEDDEDESCDAAGDRALAKVVSALATIASTEGEGVEGLLQELAAPPALAQLRAVAARLGTSMCHREAVEAALACLANIGRRLQVWPETDEALAADLARLLCFGSESAGLLLEGLLRRREAVVRLGDLRHLRTTLEARARASMRAGAVTAALEAMEATKVCNHCGCASLKSLLACTACRAAEYCTAACQRAAWRTHKPVCQKAREGAG